MRDVSECEENTVDGLHCPRWYGGGSCSYCGAPQPKAERHACRWFGVTDYTWPPKACPCGPCMSAECLESDCRWVLDPSLVPEALRTIKPGVAEYESWAPMDGFGEGKSG